MKHVLRYLTILALMACLPLAAQAVDPEIAYSMGSSGGLWVMDADGENKTLVCEGRVAYPHWSRDGNSAVFVKDWLDSDLYRIDLSGGPTGCSDNKLASKCGTFSVTENTPQYLVDLLDGESYGVPDISHLVEGLAGPAHWSPVADEVAVRVNWGLSGNRGVIAVADSWRWNDTLVPIYASAEGVRIGDFAWSPDGSKLAVVEGPIDEGGPYPNAVLKIIDLPDGDAIEEWFLADLGLDEQGPINTLDWARTDPGGYLMAYTSYVSGSPPHKGGYYVKVTDFGAETPMADQIMGGWSPSWSPDGTHLVLYTSDLNLPRDKGGVVVKVNMATREGTILGGSGTPDWKPGPTTSACVTFADCDDGNPCTNDTCDALLCAHSPNSESCDDANECTVADTCADGFCRGDVVLDGTSCSLDVCCGGQCVTLACLSDADCDDGNPDTTDICNDGDTCAATCENVGECVQTGDPCPSDSDCCSGRCHAVKGVCK